jgi:hypothetical protein
MDQAMPLQEGKLCANQTNWGPFARVRFKQTLPFPAEILNIVGDLEIGSEWCCDTVDEIPGSGSVADDASAAVFGSFSRECGHTCAFGQFAQMIYDGGTEAAGVAIRVTPTATVQTFTGLAALYIPDQNVIALVLYASQPLTNIGTVLTSITATLAVDDVLRIEASEDTPTLYSIKVNGGAIISRTVTSDEINIANSCVAAIQVVDPGTITPPVETEDDAMIATQAADLDLTNDTLADTDLSLLMAANETYVGQIVARYTSASTTPNSKFCLVGPAGAAGEMFDGLYVLEYALGVEAPNYDIIAGEIAVSVFQFTVRNGSTAGNLTFQAAQDVANATVTVFKQDSHMLMFKKV